MEVRSMEQVQRRVAMGRNRRQQSPGWVGRPWEQRSGSLRRPVISKTVNGFIALRPIPGCRGRRRAAHPGLGAWDGARVASPRCPILRPGPSSILRTTATRQFPWDRPGANRGGRMPRGLQCQRRIEYQGPHREGDGRRGEVRANVLYCHNNTKLYLYL
jgi:hypothetical protein